MSKTSLLIIDDDPTTETLVKGEVEEDRCAVVVHADMKAGLDYVKQRKPALIVLNVDLTKGWRLVTEFKKHKKYQQIPLVVISQQASQEIFYQHQTLPTRADAYLHKPLDQDTLSMTFLGLLDYSAGDPFEGQVEQDSGVLEFELDDLDFEEVEPEDAAVPEPPDDTEGLKARIDELETQLKAQQRTEEERLHKQAQVGHQKLTALQQERDEARQRIAALEGELSTAQEAAGAAGEAEELAKKNAELQARVDELVKASEQVEEQRSAQAREVEELRQQVEALEAERDATAEQAKSGAVDAAKKQAEAEARAAEAEEKLAQLRQEHDQSLQAVQKARDEAEERAAALSKELEALKASAGDADQLSGQLEAAQVYELALLQHIETLKASYQELAERAKDTDMALRETVSKYQLREGPLIGREAQAKTVSEVLANALAKVMEVAKDAHAHFDEQGEPEELPAGPEGVPAPLKVTELPAVPKKGAAPQPAKKAEAAPPEPPSAPEPKPEPAPEPEDEPGSQTLADTPFEAVAAEAEAEAEAEDSDGPPPPPPLPGDDDIFGEEPELADIQPFRPE